MSAQPANKKQPALSSRRAPKDGASPEALDGAVRRLVKSSRPAERREACALVIRLAKRDAATAFAHLEPLARDAEPAVRAAALAAAARLARAHFDDVLGTLALWRDSQEEPLRRAAALVAARSAAPEWPGRAPHLARLLQPLLGDPAPSVRRTVTTSALPALLGAYPETAFEMLVEASTSSDPAILRSIAAAFGSPPAAPLAKRALIVLRKLALDERGAVKRAVVSALWRLGRRRPDILRPELERWLDDDARRAVAREALKRL